MHAEIFQVYIYALLFLFISLSYKLWLIAVYEIVFWSGNKWKHLLSIDRKKVLTSIKLNCFVSSNILETKTIWALNKKKVFEQKLRKIAARYIIGTFCSKSKNISTRHRYKFILNVVPKVVFTPSTAPNFNIKPSST